MHFFLLLFSFPRFVQYLSPEIPADDGLDTDSRLCAQPAVQADPPEDEPAADSRLEDNRGDGFNKRYGTLDCRVVFVVVVFAPRHHQVDTTVEIQERGIGEE